LRAILNTIGLRGNVQVITQRGYLKLLSSSSKTYSSFSRLTLKNIINKYLNKLLKYLTKEINSVFI